jgi:hypothetical protein
MNFLISVMTELFDIFIIQEPAGATSFLLLF